MLSISENFRYYKLRAHASQCAMADKFCINMRTSIQNSQTKFI